MRVCVAEGGHKGRFAACQSGSCWWQVCTPIPVVAPPGPPSTWTTCLPFAGAGVEPMFIAFILHRDDLHEPRTIHAPLIHLQVF
jgi:hypothetical protein